jgi:hypothetical protein
MYAVVVVAVLCQRNRCEKPEAFTAIVVPVEQVVALKNYSAIALPRKVVVLGTVAQVLSAILR